MNRIVLALVLVLAACAERQPASPGAAGMGDMAGMQDMKGMEGMKDMADMDMRDTSRRGASDSAITLDRRAAGGLGITFARADRQRVVREIRLAGTLVYPEPSQEWITTRVDGWVERLHADYVGRPVRAGEALLALYSPALVSAQEEYLAARRLGDSALASAARRRLVLWNVPDEQIARVEATGVVQRDLVIRAPRPGEIAEKRVIQGQAVRAGDNLFLIADRGRLWVNLSVYEMDARSVRVGVPVELAVDALPGRAYRGRVRFIEPTVDATTRSLTARVEVANADGALRPGMYAVARVRPSGTPVLAVPRDAVLPTGTRNIVFRNLGDGRFAPREVVVGVRGDSLVEIVRGLEPGDEVVASATYLLDSEANLGAALQGLMLQMGMGLDMGGMTMPAMPPKAEAGP